MKKINEFKKELKELLKKYNASISFDCGSGSDLHGVYGEKLSVQFLGENRRKIEEVHTLAQGYNVDQSDL